MKLNNVKDLSKFIRRKNFITTPNGIFIGKTQKSFLVGAKIHKNFCFKCFKKRILSSDFFEVKNYLPILDQDIKIIQEMLGSSKENFQNKMIEYTIKREKRCPIFFIHFILPIPGCSCQKE